MRNDWLLLLAGSAVAGGAFALAGLPAALLLGPMLAGIVLAVQGRRVEIPEAATGFAQGLIGCLIARSLPMSLAHDVVQRWPVFGAGVLSVIVVSMALGAAMLRLKVLPGSTIVWGMSPGGAAAMTLLSAHAGADVQIVALMQYLRVMGVAAAASIVARTLGAHGAAVAQDAPWFPAVDAAHLAATLAIAAGGPWLAKRMGFRSGALLLPMIVAVLLQHAIGLQVELPRGVLAVGYAIVGWRIGLGFTRPLLVHAARALPVIVGCTSLLIALCGGLALGLQAVTGTDLLTAYLAMSPGGLDSVAIIAASNRVDLTLVMTMQLVRFVAVLFVGPALARWVVGLDSAVEERSQRDE